MRALAWLAALVLSVGMLQLVLWAGMRGGWVRFVVALVLVGAGAVAYVLVQRHDIDREWRGLP